MRVKILTGDNEIVTRKICNDVGLAIDGVVLGRDIDAADDEALGDLVETHTVFAKVSPRQKARIIAACQHNGHVVGFLGDGINDSAGLKAADVGVSVDTAVDIAKESADIILLEKNLGVLGEGVIEGRKVFGNITKYIKMGASSNFGNMFSVVGASIILPFLPMAPIQVLTNNLLYDFSQTAIPTDNVDEDYLLTPHRWDIGNIMKFMIFIGPISSIFDYVTYFTMIFRIRRVGQTRVVPDRLVRRIAFDADADHSHHPHGEDSVRRKPGERGVDFDIDPDLRGGGCVAIHLDRRLARLRAAAAALLARRDRDHRLLRRPDAYRKDMVRAAMGHVNGADGAPCRSVIREPLASLCVIPGRRSEAEASPESMNTDCGVWIPGCLAALGPRNDTSDIEESHAIRDQRRSAGLGRAASAAACAGHLPGCVQSRLCCPRRRPAAGGSGPPDCMGGGEALLRQSRRRLGPALTPSARALAN